MYLKINKTLVTTIIMNFKNAIEYIRFLTEKIKKQIMSKIIPETVT